MYLIYLRVYLLFKSFIIILPQYLHSKQSVMSLAESIFLHQNRKDNQIKSVNLDLNLINAISNHVKTITNKPKLSNISLNNLSDILKNKNQKYHVYRHQRQQARQWLKNKGVDFRKIQQEIKTNAKQAEERAAIVSIPSELQRATEIQEGSFGFTSESQQSFILNQKDNAINSIFIKSLNPKVEGRTANLTRNVLLKKVRRQGKSRTMMNHSIAEDQQEEQSYSKSDHIHNLEKRNQYFEFVQALSVEGFERSLHKLKAINSFWSIVYQHIKTIQHYLSNLSKMKGYEKDKMLESFQQNINSFILMKSVKLIQKQNEKQINGKNLEDKVRQLQSKNKKLKVWRNYDGKPVWALAYFFFRAGKMMMLKQVLENEDRQYIEDLFNYQESLDRQVPQPSVKRYDMQKYRDNYFNQLIYILTATSRYDAEIISNNDLDTIWILLRTIGIYRHLSEYNQQYKQVVESLFQKAADESNSLTKKNIEKYLYLGAYKEMLQLCEISLEKKDLKEDSEFNIDDYIHLFTVINYHPELYGQQSQLEKERLKKIYTQTLGNYIQILYQQKYFNIIPSYLLLVPSDQLVEVACNFINTKVRFEEFDWRKLKKLMVQRDQQSGSATYEYLTEEVLKSLKLSSFRDYVFAIQKYRNKFYNSTQSVFKEQKYCITILLKRLYFMQKKKFQNFKQNKDLSHWQKQLNQFLEISQNNMKDMDEVEKELNYQCQKCEKRLNQKKLSQHHNNIYYLQTVVYPYEFYLQFERLNNILNSPSINEIKEFNPKWFQNLSLINVSAGRVKPVPSLLRFLDEQTGNSISALYVFYLQALIRRKQIIADAQCDFYGLTEYKKEILRQILQLQKYYKGEDNLWWQMMRQFWEQQQSDQINNPFKFCIQYRYLKSQLVGDVQNVKNNYQNYQYSQRQPFDLYGYV